MKINIIITATLCFIPLVSFSRDRGKKKDDLEVVENKLPEIKIAAVNFGQVVNGEPIDLKKLEGKIVLLHEVELSSDKSREGISDTLRLAKNLEKKGVIIIGFEPTLSNKDEILKLIEKKKVTYPIIMKGSTNTHGLGTGFSSYSLFDREGKLVFQGSTEDPKFKDLLKKMLKDEEKTKP
jgi:hypothetical protein